MKLVQFCFFLIGFVILTHGQTITILDEISGAPLESVSIIDLSRTRLILTDQNGQADISSLNLSNEIQISLIGYQSQTFSYNVLKGNGFNVKLVQNILSFDQVVVSASRWDQSNRNIPAKIVTIKPSDITFNNPQTAADLLGNTGKVFIQKSQQGGGSPMIRGFATNRLIYAVDGVRMNTAIFRAGNIQNVISLDGFAIESAEVMFGPGSVLYGSDAIGGVMSFQTLTPKLSITDGKSNISGKAIVRYSSANEERTGHFDINFGGKKWASVTSISYNDFGDLRMGKNGPDDYLKPFIVERVGNEDVFRTNPDSLVQSPSAYTQYNLTQKIRFKPNENWDIQYGLHISETSEYARYDRHLRLRNGKPRYAEWNYGPQTWSMNQLKVTNFGSNTWYDQASLNIAFQTFGESRIDRDFNEVNRQIQTEAVDAWSANVDFIKSLSEKQKLFYGVEFVTNEVKSTGSFQNITTGVTSNGPARYPKATWSSFGVYTNYQRILSEKVSLQAGARYNQFALDATYDLTFFPLPFSTSKINNGAFTGSLGAVFRPTTSWSIFANLSTGFRAPNVDDTGKVFDSAPGTVTVPNSDVKAEYAYNAEVGFVKVMGDRLKVDITAYYTLLQNALVRRTFTLNGQDSIDYKDELSQVLSVQNAANASVYGLQAGINIKILAGFSLSSDYNVQIGEEELDNGQTSPSRHAAPSFGSTRLIYQKGKWHCEINSQYTASKSFEQLPDEEQGKTELYAKDGNGKPFAPSWQIFNIRGQYQCTQKLSLTLAIENISDQRYRPYSSGLAGSGRNFVVSGLFKF
ncbi:MAG TPA: TonB-dependent receptor [Saprospiraceae bacterium]|nr:TonB-dependent receptor [Saprospiraceae bacterium]